MRLEIVKIWPRSPTRLATIAQARQAAGRLGPALALLGLSAIWGYNWVVMKKALAYCGPFDFAALRTVLGAVALFAALAWRRQTLRLPSPGSTIAIGLTQTGAFLGLTMWALASGAAGKTAVLIYTMPVWLVVLAWPLLGEKVRGRQWWPVAMAFTGLACLLAPWQAQGPAQAEILAALAGLSWAASAVLVKQARAREHVDLLSLTAWQMLAGGLALTLVALAVPQREIEWSGYFWAALFYNAVPGTAIAWLLWLYILRALPAAAAGVGSLTIPVVGVLSAWVELGERPAGADALGMALILAALGLTAWLGWRRPRTA